MLTAPGVPPARYLFLFDKVVIVCKRKGYSYELKEVIELLSHKMTDDPMHNKDIKKVGCRPLGATTAHQGWATPGKGQARAQFQGRAAARWGRPRPAERPLGLASSLRLLQMALQLGSGLHGDLRAPVWVGQSRRPHSRP